MSKQNQPIKHRFTVALTIIFCSHFIVAIIIISLNNDFIIKEKTENKETSNDFPYVKVAILDRVNHITRDVQLIADVIHSNTGSNYFSQDNSISNLFKSMIETRNFYDQVRLLDNKGKEILRLNKGTSNAVKVSKDKLQDKSTRYYFKDIKSSNPNQFYISKLDWNIEADSVELPLKATIRIGIPIKFGPGTSNQGVLLINYLAAGLVSNINVIPGEEYLLISQDGVTAFNPDAANLLNSEHLFNKKYPDLWNTMQNHSKGLFKASNYNYQYEQLSFSNINNKSYSTIWLVKKQKILPPTAANSPITAYFAALALSFAFSTIATLILFIKRRSIKNLTDKNTVTA